MSDGARSPGPRSPGARRPPDPCRGAVAAELRSELPGLDLWWSVAPGGVGPVPDALERRLRALSDRGRGIDAVALRSRPVVRAYRVFARQVGLDPDHERVPAESAAVARLIHGRHRARERIAAACLVAVIETGVGIRALDARAVAAEGPGLRLDGRRVVVADPDRVHAPLFGEPLPGSAPGPQTRTVVLFAVGVPGVPEVHLHEALWQAQEALGV